MKYALSEFLNYNVVSYEATYLKIGSHFLSISKLIYAFQAILEDEVKETKAMQDTLSDFQKVSC